MARNVSYQHVRMVSVPKNITELNKMTKGKVTSNYIEFEGILHNDNTKPEDLFKLKDLIKSVCIYCNSESFPLVIDEIRTTIQKYKVIKKEELEFDKESKYLAPNDVLRPNGSNHYVSVGIREITRKLNLIDEIERFILEYSMEGVKNINEPLKVENSNIKQLTALERSNLEIEMWQYFSEFSEEGITPKIFKKRTKTSVKRDGKDWVKSDLKDREGTNLSLPEYDIKKDDDFFKNLFLKKQQQSTYEPKRFIEHEILVFETEFNDLSKDPELPIILNWIHHLELELKKLIAEWVKGIDEITPIIKTLPKEEILTKSEILKPKLLEYKFHELEKVKALTTENRNVLIKEIAESELPYQISMLDYLGFLDYLEKNHFQIKYKLRAELVKILDAKDRSIKGNIYVLNDYSKENRSRYTAHKHKEKVIIDYQKLI